jgi:hypothetical protein
LTITEDEIDRGVDMIDTAVESVERDHRPVQRSPLHETLEHPLREE